MPPIAYFITFHTYATWVHGDDRGSVDRHHNEFATSPIEPDPGRQWEAEQRLSGEPVVLDADRRSVVDATIRQVCQHRKWQLWELNVRTNHVHVVLTAEADPEPVMNALKSWATRRMVEAGLMARGSKVWTRHGSTRYLWNRDHLDGAMKYVREYQGRDLPMR